MSLIKEIIDLFKTLGMGFLSILGLLSLFNHWFIVGSMRELIGYSFAVVGLVLISATVEFHLRGDFDE